MYNSSVGGKVVDCSMEWEKSICKLIGLNAD